MKIIVSFATTLVMLFSLVGCLSSSSDDSSSSGSGGSGSSGGSSSYDGAGSVTDYPYSCPGIPGSFTAKVYTGTCRSESEEYVEVFGCNDVNRFRSACTGMYSCLVSNSTGSYAGLYQQYLDSCSMY